MTSQPATLTAANCPPPTVLVTVVNYNSGDWLRRCAEAVLASTVPVALRIGDNGSSDASLADLPADPRLTVLRNNANLGFATALNRLLADSDAPWLLVLNPDCRIEADTLERLLTIAEAHPQVGMFGCLIANPDGSEQRGCRRRLPTLGTAALRSLGLGRLFNGRANFDLTGSPLPSAPIEQEAISGAFMLIRRAALQAVGPMDEGYFLHCEDLDWCARFPRAGWPILFVPSVRVTHEQGSCSVSRPYFVEWHKHRGMLRYYAKFHGRLGALLLAPLVWARFALVALRRALR